jgi:hypothetical protein
MKNDIMAYFCIYMLDKQEEILKLDLLTFEQFILSLNIKDHYNHFFRQHCFYCMV